MSAPTDVEVTLDVAGSLGFGAFYNNEWFSGAWMPSKADQSIAYKEFFSCCGGFSYMGLAVVKATRSFSVR